MPVLMVQDASGGTREQYEEVCSRLSGGGGLNSLSDWPTDGILSHAAGPTDDGWGIVDVWESEEAFQQGVEETEAAISRDLTM